MRTVFNGVFNGVLNGGGDGYSHLDLLAIVSLQPNLRLFFVVMRCPTPCGASLRYSTTPLLEIDDGAAGDLATRERYYAIMHSGSVCRTDFAFWDRRCHPACLSCPLRRSIDRRRSMRMNLWLRVVALAAGAVGALAGDNDVPPEATCSTANDVVPCGSAHYPSGLAR